MIVEEKPVDLSTPTGPMRAYLHAPAAGTEGRRYPGVLLYSEIVQQTGPIRRAAARLAGHGYIVLVPEVFHQHEPPGTVLPYDPTGTEKGNPGAGSE
jgi:carboxymethylenebutenolidase